MLLEALQTRDPAQVQKWWWMEPDANVGVVCGDGLVVLDVDGPAGEAAVQDFELPVTPEVRSARGRHLYFTGTAGNLTAILPKCDVRGAGGLVVGAGSVHKSGARYEWVVDPSESPRAPLPAWLKDLIARRGTSHEDAVGGVICEGRRNTTLTRLAGAMRRHACTGAAMGAALRVDNRARCAPPLQQSEIDRIVRSAETWSNAPRWILDPGGFVSDARLTPSAGTPSARCATTPRRGSCLPGSAAARGHHGHEQGHRQARHRRTRAPRSHPCHPIPTWEPLSVARVAGYPIPFGILSPPAGQPKTTELDR
jgi:hypothetical protein